MQYQERVSRPYQRILNRIPILGDVLQRPLGVLGFVIVLGFMLMVIFAPLLTSYGFAEQNIPSMLQGPSKAHWLGTDHLGRDLWSRIVHGSRIALSVALPSVAIALTTGVIVGLVAGYVGGIVDDITLVILDSLQAFPAVILALTILALLGPSLANVIIVIGLAWTPGYARIARAQVLTAKQNQYIEVERSLGASQTRILGIHILPNILAPLLILAAMDLPVVITFEAGLSFLGLGVRPPTPSWGVVLSDGFNFIRQSPWPITWAGLTLIITTLGFTLFGETLRDVLDPALSGTRGA
ncbi:MAG: ABC transporter permease [Anaerolineae bacterium]|jgi:peptide/nickel transport system permease protein|nr:ABC transporter permease [Anaerolineae bacterium]MDX9833311.1 ABC transporter permease [Anaerolineae bacterium]